MSEKQEPTEFGRKLSAMLHAETRTILSERDQDKQAEGIAEIISLLASSLGTAIAIAAAGEPKNIDALLMGVENHIAETAAEKASDARMLRLGYAVLGPDRQ